MNFFFPTRMELKFLIKKTKHRDTTCIIESERAKRTHCCTLIEILLYIYIYSVTKILRKIRATTFTENYGKLRVRGMSERCFQLVLITRSFTRSLPARIQWLTRHKPLKLFFFGLHEANLYNFLRRLLDT